MTIVLMSVMLTVALPRVGEARKRFSVEAAAQRLVSDLNRGRTEAIRGNTSVALRRVDSYTYQVGALTLRGLEHGVSFVTAFDSVRYASTGNVTIGAGSIALANADYSRTVKINASGFASVQ